ncbi:MAG: succinate dehydrogenase/fumarate reductase iron-sulfur subunit [Spirochaetaceae bacterium]|nr:succinate dehydrogenase/fumarate reductase iron-sulfur subunit [Spirochaetaceae bacterium]
MVKQIKSYSISIRRNEDSYMNFIIEMDNSLTVIDALDEIRKKIDSSITYRHSCHHGSCGTCACIINKKERLACMCFLNEFEDNKIIIEPLTSFKIISDLVVDISTMINKLEGSTYLRESEIGKDSIKPNGILNWNRFENCIECGSCVSACPVKSDFIGPANLASIDREISKQTDEKVIKNLKNKAFKNNGVDACDKHYLCSKVCPTKVYPGKHINNLRKIKSKN